MANKVKQRMTCAASMLMGMLLLTACASSDSVRQQPPSYAIMADGLSYRVTCMGINVKEIYVNYHSVDTFFHPDGSEKTREEFCEEGNHGASSSR